MAGEVALQDAALETTAPRGVPGRLSDMRAGDRLVLRGRFAQRGRIVVDVGGSAHNFMTQGSLPLG